MKQINPLLLSSLGLIYVPLRGFGLPLEGFWGSLTLLFISALALEFFLPHLPGFLQTPLQWFRTLVLEVVALLYCCAVYWIDGEIIPQEKRKGRPILLLQGYMMVSSSCWWWMRHRLRQEGLGPVYTVDFKNPFGSIEDFAKITQARVQEILKETGSQDISLVGHSMGGLIATYYALNLAPPKVVKEVITLGTPFAGSYLAFVCPGKCSFEMRLGGSFVQKLREGLQKNSYTKFVTIDSTTDLLVWPHNSAVLPETQARRVCFQGVGHVQMLLSDPVINVVCQELTK